MKQLPLIVCSLLGLMSGRADAQPVIETFDRFEMNWSSMRMRYFGEASLDPQQGYSSAEKDATSKGLLYALSTIPKVREQKGLPADLPGVAETVTKQSYVFNTIYFSDGRVRVELNSSLAQTLDPGGKKFASEMPTASPGDSTSIQIEIKNAKSPFVVEEIQSDEGEVVYSSADIAKEAFKRQLTGRWFYTNSSELKEFSGSKPIKIQGGLQSGRIVVDKDEWVKVKRENERLLQEAKIAYILPAE